MRWVLLQAAWLMTALPVRADDALARALFEQGLAAAATQRWEEAASKFDASLAQRDMPATRFNLMLASDELSRYLDVARHSIAFLESELNRARGDARAEAERLLEKATGKLAMVEIGSLPACAQLRVDGREPSLIHDGRVFLAPGPHILSLHCRGQPDEQTSVVIRGGQSLAWPRSLPQVQAEHGSASQAPPPANSTRGAAQAIADESIYSRKRAIERAAQGLGGVGAAAALSALVCYGVTQRRANLLAEGGPERPGYPSDADHYERVRRTVVPLALAGGGLIAGAIALSHISRIDALPLSITGLVLGAGMFGAGLAFLILEPRPLITDTQLDRPTREVASLLTAAGLSLLSYGISAQLRRGARRTASAGISALRVVW